MGFIIAMLHARRLERQLSARESECSRYEGIFLWMIFKKQISAEIRRQIEEAMKKRNN